MTHALLVAFAAVSLVVLVLGVIELVRQRRGLMRMAETLVDIDERLPDPRAQAWFWTEEWQEGEREVDEDLLAGKGRVFDSDQEFLAWLGARVAAPAQMPPVA